MPFLSNITENLSILLNQMNVTNYYVRRLIDGNDPKLLCTLDSDLRSYTIKFDSNFFFDSDLNSDGIYNYFYLHLKFLGGDIVNDDGQNMLHSVFALKPLKINITNPHRDYEGIEFSFEKVDYSKYKSQDFEYLSGRVRRPEDDGIFPDDKDFLCKYYYKFAKLFYLQCNTNPAKQDKDNNTPLHIAFTNNLFSYFEYFDFIIKRMIDDKRVDLTAQNNKGETIFLSSLKRALRNNHDCKDIIKYMINSGKNLGLEIADVNGNTAISVIFDKLDELSQQTPSEKLCDNYFEYFLLLKEHLNLNLSKLELQGKNSVLDDFEVIGKKYNLKDFVLLKANEYKENEALKNVSQELFKIYIKIYKIMERKEAYFQGSIAGILQEKGLPNEIGLLIAKNIPLSYSDNEVMNFALSCKSARNVALGELDRVREKQLNYNWQDKIVKSDEREVHARLS